MTFLLLFLFFILLFRFFRNYILKPKKINSLSIYFGVPGSGKTTLCAYFTKRYSKYWKVFSNVPILGAYQYDINDIGKYDISNCVLLLDEASIDYNNRNWRHGNMSQEAIKWWKLHRHAGVMAVLFSQSWNDCDATLRRLSTKLYLVKKSWIPFVITTCRINRSIGIDENTHEPCDIYKFDHPVIRLSTNHRYFAPRYWKMFDSWSMPELPKKIWKTY